MNIIIRDMRKDDAFVVASLMHKLDNISFTQWLGTVSCVAKYIEETFGAFRLFSGRFIKVAEVDKQVVGLCIIYDTIPDVVLAKDTSVIGLNATFDDVWVENNFSIQLAQERGCAYLDSLIVAEAYRKRGIGRKLMESVLNEYPDVLLFCDEANIVALDFYCSLGFCTDGVMFGINDASDSLSNAWLCMVRHG